MKTMRLLIGITELIMALTALIAVLSSVHPIAKAGLLLVALFGGKGLLYVYLALSKKEEEYE
jgi:hypothetical protein